MDTESVTISVDRLTLATLGDGAAEEQFQSEIVDFLSRRDEHVDAIDDGGVYATKDGCLRAQVIVAVDLVYSVETGAVAVSWSTAAKHPSRKGSSTRVLAREGKLLVERDGNQMALLSSSRRKE